MSASSSGALSADPVAEFRQAIAAAGLAAPDHIEADGKLHRFRTGGSGTSGFYTLHLDGLPAGHFGDWRSGHAETWRANVGRPLTTAEHRENKARIAVMKTQREAAEAEQRAEARQRAAAIWDAAEAAPADHAYLQRKGVKVHGLRVHDGALVVPVYADGALQSVQFIDTNGKKLFLPGGRTAGCYFIIGTPGDVICTAEGYATAASIFEATGYACAVAFSAGNLQAVAKTIKADFPAARLIVCADNDATAGNPGLTAATEAARATGAGLAVPPTFGDFNDMHQASGLEAVRAAIEAAEPLPPVRQPDGVLLPEIIVRGGNLAETVDEATSALVAGGAPIYRRGTDLYRTARITVDEVGPVRRSAGATVLRLLASDWLRVEIAKAATFRRLDVRKNQYLPADPHRDLAGLVIARADDYPWPELRAIARHPVVTLDGRIIDAAGYDAETGLLLDIAGAWPIPKTPPREIAQAAVQTLRQFLRNYPWAGDADEAVALSLIVTALMRPVLATAPLHGVDATAAGSGKTLLADAVASIATGQPAAVLDYGRDPAEAAKRLDSAMLAGDAIITLDNIEAPLEGAALCQSLTSTTRLVRILGLSKTVTIPCTALLIATGNNLTLKGDVVRRAVVCRLDAGIDRPELREFTQDLIAEARERRAELVAAALTIPLAYIQAGRPVIEDMLPLGSFADWDRTVRAALIWAGTADPCTTTDRARESDPSRQALTVLLTIWAERFGTSGATAAHAVKAAEHDPDLGDALADVCLVGGKLNAKALGFWLRKRRDSRSGDLVLRGKPGHGGLIVWTVTGGDGGDGGFVLTPYAKSVRKEKTDNRNGLDGYPPSQPYPPSEPDGDPWDNGWMEV